MQNPLTVSEARKLATTIAKQSSGVSIKFGRTNGHPVLHLIHGGSRSSTTIQFPWQWDEHPWHKQNWTPGPTTA